MSVKPHYTQYSLNGGEVSHRFAARQDINKYLAACEIMENWQPLPLGGSKFRCGSAYVATAKNSGLANSRVRMGKFLFNSEQAYSLEWGDEYVRFYKDGAQIAGPLELATPYPLLMLDDLVFIQSADIMWILSDGTLQVRKLARIDNNPDAFTLTTANFDSPGVTADEPTGFELNGAGAAGTLTPGAVTGDGITFMAGAPVFVQADVGRFIIYLTSRAIITAFVSGSQVTADIIDDFPNLLPIPAEDWRLKGILSTKLNTNASHQGDAVRGTAAISAFRSNDVGKFIEIYGGFMSIDRVQSSTVVAGRVLSDFIDILPQDNPPNTTSWVMWRNAWTAELGFPSFGTLYKGRLWLGRNQTRWGSRIEDYENFAFGSDDDAAISRTLSDDEINDIRWIKGGANGLFSATSNSTYRAVASQEKGPLTPDDFNEEPVSGLGAARIAPIRTIDGTLLYVEDGRKQLVESAFDFVENKFKSPDLLLLATHLTEGRKIVGFDYQKRPNSTLCCWTDDGILLLLTYLRNEEVVAWSRTVTDGRFISATIIPRPETSQDWVWVAVERGLPDLTGELATYIEQFEEDADICRDWPELYTDSAVIVQAADVVNNQITGLDHLEGKTVWVIGDGQLFNVDVGQDAFGTELLTSNAIVTDGAITLSPTLEEVPVLTFEIGLPYTGDVIPLEPRIPDQLGGQGMVKGWAWIGMRFRRTLGLHFGVRLNEGGVAKEVKQAMRHRRAGHAMDRQVPLQRGKRHMAQLGYDGTGQLLVRQTLPFPAEVLSLYGSLNISDEPVDVLWDEPMVICNQPEPPVEPPELECPDEPTITHIDAGFRHITISDFAFDHTTRVVYYGGNPGLQGIISKFNMDAAMFVSDSFGNGKQWQKPGVGATGDLYVTDTTLGGGSQRLVEVDPITLGTIRESAVTPNLAASMPLLVSSTRVYALFSSGLVNRVMAFDKTTLAVSWSYTSVSAFGFGNRICRGCVDSSGNLWFVTFGSGLVGLHRITPSNVRTSFNLAPVHTATFINSEFDSVNNAIITIGSDGILGKFDIGGSSISNSGIGSIGFDLAKPVDGKIWRNGAGNLTEYQISDWSVLQTVLAVDMVGAGGPIAGWQNMLYMPDTNCLHLAHGTVTSSPNGGVDKLCLTC